jgi:hypothetical protein
MWKGASCSTFLCQIANEIAHQAIPLLPDHETNGSLTALDITYLLFSIE